MLENIKEKTLFILTQTKWANENKVYGGKKSVKITSNKFYLFELTLSEWNYDGMLKCNLSSVNKITKTKTNILDYFHVLC